MERFHGNVSSSKAAFQQRPEILHAVSVYAAIYVPNSMVNDLVFVLAMQSLVAAELIGEKRGSRFHGFTTEGERVLEWARRIVGDARAMRQDVDALKRGLAGHLRIAAIPTALAMSAMLTTPYRAKHPNVRFTILSRTSIQVLNHLENLEVDAGLTYLDNEPLGHVQSVRLYLEEYRFLTSSSGQLGTRDKVSWAEVAKVPLCLLTPDMQNRRIIDGLLRSAGAEPSPTLESNSMIVLFAHVRTGQWATIMPARLAETLGLTDSVRAIPIVEPEATHAVGLVVPERRPTTPLIGALIREARQLAKTLDQPSPPTASNPGKRTS